MRLFLAIELPEAVRNTLSQLQAQLRSSWSGWRWVRPESIHLTVRFLGDVGSGLDAASRDGWRAAAAAVRPFDIRLGGLGRFPKGGAARVLWVGIEEEGGGGRLADLAGKVEQAAREAGFEPENRPFRPHLTLARARRGERPRWAEGGRFESGERVRVDRMILFSSQLHPAGARYTAIDSYNLEG